MKTENRQAIEIIGVIAVVLSLLFVAYEIRQANRISNATIMFDLLNDYSMLDQAVFESEETADLLTKLRDPNSELNAIEYERARAFTFRYINIWGAHETAYLNGLLNDEQMEVILVEIGSLLNEFPRSRPIFQETLDYNPAVEYLTFVEILKENINK